MMNVSFWAIAFDTPPGPKSVFGPILSISTSLRGPEPHTSTHSTPQRGTTCPRQS
jgi:hypothetical protein